MRVYIVLFTLAGTSLTNLVAQQPDTPEQMTLIRTLLARIEKLEQRVAELEKTKAEAAMAAAHATHVPAPPQPEGQAPSQEQIHREHAQLVAGEEAQQEYPALHISGFSDFNFSFTDEKGSRSGFNEGQLVLHLSSALSPRVSVFAETTFTARPDAGTGSPPAGGFDSEVERAIVRFDHSDYLKVSFGRYHTPVNWWNTTFHHGLWLQTTVTRPEMTQVGGVFVPVHFVGGLVEGALPAKGLNFNYNFGVGNGRGAVLSRGGDHGDVNNHRAWLANFFLKPDRIFGLQVGGSVYRDKIARLGGRDFGEWITSGHIVWLKENPEVIAEFANINHKEIAGPSNFNSQAFYIQTAYRLPWFQKLWKPYYRFEYIRVPRGDPMFQRALPTLDVSTVGLRYDISSFAAIKFEYRNQRRRGEPRINGGFIQTSFTF